MKSLIKAGFVRTEHLDFGDDGNHFKMYSYKGLPMSYLCSQGQYYISYRIEGFNYFEYEHLNHLTDEFNGCSEVDVDKLIENGDKILQGLSKIVVKPVNKQRLIDQAQKELVDVINFLRPISILDANETMIRYAKKLKDTVELQLTLIENASDIKLRYYDYVLNTNGNFNENSFYISQIKEMLK